MKRLALVALLALAGGAQAYVEPPVFADQVRAGKLPPVEKRVPQKPLVVPLGEAGTSLGRYGGALQTPPRGSPGKRAFPNFRHSRARGVQPQPQNLPPPPPAPP